MQNFAAATSWLAPYPNLWVRPYIIVAAAAAAAATAAATTLWLAPYPDLWVRPYYAVLQFFPISSLDRIINCCCVAIL